MKKEDVFIGKNGEILNDPRLVKFARRLRDVVGYSLFKLNNELREKIPDFSDADFEMMRFSEYFTSVKTGRGNMYQLISPDKKNDGSLDGRLENFEASCRNAAARLCSTDEGRERAYHIYMSLKKAYGLTVVELPGDGRVLVGATRSEITDEGVIPREAFAIQILRNGVSLRKLREGDFSYKDGIWQFEPDYNCTTELGLGDDVKISISDIPLSSFASVDRNFWIRVSSILQENFSSFSGSKEKMERFVGEKIETRKWVGFLTSARKVKDLYQGLPKLFFASLEDDVRAYCMGNYKNNVRVYNWICGGGDMNVKRVRAQAVREFPLLTYILPRVEKDIDEKKPLVDAIARYLGVNRNVVRALRGINWSKVNKNNDLKDTGIEFLSSLNAEKMEFLKDVPLVKATKVGDWRKMAKTYDLMSSLMEREGDPAASRLSANMLASIDSWQEVELDVLDSITRTAQLLTVAVSGRGDLIDKTQKEEKFWKMERDIIALLLTRISNDGNSLKRLKRFSENWHSHTLDMDNLKRRVRDSSDKPHNTVLEWSPLTESFDCEFGSLRWLTSSDELDLEGYEMKHCVGGYTRQCLSGVSNIASIIGVDGSRSTAEFIVSGNTIELRQNRAFKNQNPSECCSKVAEIFFKKHKSDTFEREDLRLEQQRNVFFLISDSLSAQIISLFNDMNPCIDGICEEISDIYEDCIQSSKEEVMSGNYSPKLIGQSPVQMEIKVQNEFVF